MTHDEFHLSCVLLGLEVGPDGSYEYFHHDHSLCRYYPKSNTYFFSHMNALSTQDPQEALDNITEYLQSTQQKENQ